MIRVCHLISGDLWAGAEAVSYNLLKCLKILGDIDLSAILLNEGKLADAIRGLGVPVDIVEENRCNTYQVTKEIKNKLLLRSPNIIHSHGYKSNILAYLSTRNQNNIKLLSTQHGLPEFSGKYIMDKYSIIQKINFMLMSRKFHMIIAVSHDTKNILIKEYKFKDRHIKVIHNGINIYKNVKKNDRKEYFAIGSLGRISRVKDFSLMVEIAREIYKITNKIRFELAGDGPDMKNIINLINKYKLGEIFLLKGFISNVKEFYNGIDLYLNTSIHEGIPVSILEAMAFGIPVVAPDVGGIKEIINNGTEGYVLNTRDPKIFSDYCISLYNNNSRRLSMGYAAQKRVENCFSDERMAFEYNNLYKIVV